MTTRIARKGIWDATEIMTSKYRKVKNEF